MTVVVVVDSDFVTVSANSKAACVEIKRQLTTVGFTVTVVVVVDSDFVMLA